jgi:hypothetical protein
MLRPKKGLKTKTAYFKSNYKLSLYLKLKILASLFKRSELKYKVFIKIKQNNIFCTFINIINNRIILVASAGKLKVNVSKKSLRFFQRKIILKFLKKLSFILRRFTDRFLLVEFNGPTRVRKKIIKHFKLLKQKSQNLSIFFIFKPLKMFNGCRPLKKKRKKGFRHNISI